MLNKMSNCLYRILSKGVEMDNDSCIVITYGIELALYSIVSTIGLLLIGVVFRQFHSTGCIISLFYINQTIGGGVHKKTHLSCFFLMVCGLICSLLIIRINLPNELWYVIGILGLITLFFCPLVLHENKVFLIDRKIQLKNRSKIIVVIELIIESIGYCYFPLILREVSIAIAISALSRIIAYKENVRNKICLKQHR